MIDDQDGTVAERFDDILDGQVDELFLLIEFRQDAHVRREETPASPPGRR